VRLALRLSAHPTRLPSILRVGVTLSFSPLRRLTAGRMPSLLTSSHPEWPCVQSRTLALPIASIANCPTPTFWTRYRPTAGACSRHTTGVGSCSRCLRQQYSNPNNPLAHYDGTAEEILEQCGG
jgi:hypothetical protein